MSLEVKSIGKDGIEPIYLLKTARTDRNYAYFKGRKFTALNTLRTTEVDLCVSREHYDLLMNDCLDNNNLTLDTRYRVVSYAVLQFDNGRIAYFCCLDSKPIPQAWQLALMRPE